MFDEDVPEEGQSGGGNTKGSINQGRTKGGNFQVAPEDEIAPADRDELRNDNETQEPGFAARAQVHITRPGKGAMTVICVMQDGHVDIEDIYFFPKAEMADPKSAEQAYSSNSLYHGPPFSQLDEDLQALLERMLEERGINEAMATFIPDYIDTKEQNEYIRWLGSKFCRPWMSLCVVVGRLTVICRHEVVRRMSEPRSLVLILACTTSRNDGFPAALRQRAKEEPFDRALPGACVPCKNQPRPLATISTCYEESLICISRPTVARPLHLPYLSST